MTNSSHYHIILLRHGESIANAKGLLQGQSDFPLTDTGVQQARNLARQWKTNNNTFDLIIASPLSRARETAREISKTLQLPVIFDRDWRERNFGNYEKKSYEEIISLDGGDNFSHPIEPVGGGESLSDLFLRAGKALQAVLRRAPGKYLIVSHGAILNMTLYHILGLSPHGNPKSPRFVFGNTGFIELLYFPEQLQWRFLGFVNQSRQGEEIQGR